MEVTKSNFAELLPSIKEAIDGCDFVAIDTELTGLYNSRSNEHAFDTMEERYAKLRQKCSNFLIVQFGISAFKYHPKENKYTHKDYNFYVFPQQHIKQAPDPVFLCQSSSLQFLASHGFDFNKTIYQGIPYLRHDQEAELSNKLTNKHRMEQSALSSAKESPKLNGQKVIDIPAEHKQFIAGINEQVDSFIANESEKVIALEPCSPYQRKLIYESVRQKHQTGIDMSTKTNEENQKYVSILKCTELDKMEKLKMKQMCDLEDLDAAVGFRKIMDYLSASKKLIMGHCMYLDILHMIEQFFFPLPEDLREYKSMVRMTFPHLLDTKYMASSDKLRPFLESTALADLFKLLQGKAFEVPKVELEDGLKGYESNSGQYHEAGYDAFMCGLCFIGMSQKLGSIASPKIQHVAPSSKILSPYVNRLHVLRHFDIWCLNLSGPDPEPDRENIFYVSFPEEWKTFDLVELFLPYGNIYVHWLDSVSALVALKNAVNTLCAKSGLLNKPSRLYVVKPYSEYQSMVRCLNSEPSPAVTEKPSPSSHLKPVVSKRRNSGSSDSTGSCSMDLIPEDDENEAETVGVSDLPPAKKLKPVEEENEASEVSSTAKVFEEDHTW